MELIIDNREKKIKKFFEENNKIIQKNLDIGDIQFNLDGKLILLIERKTIKDLISSIKSKRYIEQKTRLIENIPKDKILYLIEGDLNKYGDKIDGLSKEVVTSVFISLLIKNNIKIYQTKNVDETCKFLKKIYDKLDKNPDKIICKDDKNVIGESNNGEKYLKCIKLKKKKNITREICYLSQLSQIPGISNAIAIAINKKYGNLLDLYSAYKDNPELLKNLEYEIKDGKYQKMSKKKSEKIYEFIFQNE